MDGSRDREKEGDLEGVARVAVGVEGLIADGEVASAEVAPECVIGGDGAEGSADAGCGGSVPESDLGKDDLQHRYPQSLQHCRHFLLFLGK